MHVEKQNTLLRSILDQNLVGKRPLGRPRGRWENLVENYVETLKDGID